MEMAGDEQHSAPGSFPHYTVIQIQRDKSCKQKAVANLLPECFSESLKI